MAFTGINSEDRLVQKTFADHLEKALGWESVYAWNTEVFGTPHPPWERKLVAHYNLLPVRFHGLRRDA